MSAETIIILIECFVVLVVFIACLLTLVSHKQVDEVTKNLTTQLEGLKTLMERTNRKEAERRNDKTLKRFGRTAHPRPVLEERITVAHDFDKQQNPRITFRDQSWDLSVVTWVPRPEEEDTEHGILWYQRWPLTKEKPNLVLGAALWDEYKHHADTVYLYLNEFARVQKVK